MKHPKSRRACRPAVRIQAAIVPVLALIGANAASAGTLIVSNTTLSGINNGAQSGGYQVQSGTLTINNGTLSNFLTIGGSGSGGGAGLGGAIFVGSGASAVLNNVTVSGNTAIGGQGGTASSTGGVLNQMFKGGTASSGGAGNTPFDNAILFGDGQGNGVAGTNGGNGANGLGSFGGTGGSGGAGEDGWSTNPILLAQVAFYTGQLITLGIEEGADDANPLTENVGVGVAAEIVDAGANLAIASANLVLWQDANSAGRVGLGGVGGGGGVGGIGAIGLGGGAGGIGGAAGGGTGGAIAGVGGSGGTGGTGGFGGGGGVGGNGGSGSTTGPAGNGGAGGFGGGVGSTGTGNGVSAPSGGGGGSGLGGAIFVATGGSLTITGNTTFSQNNVVGGGSLNGGVNGQAAGSDLVVMHGASVLLNPGAGNVITFNGSIADDSATSIPSAIPAGQGGGITISSGLVVLNGLDTYSGQTLLTGGVLRAADGQGLSQNSNLNIQGGILETSGLFNRFVGTASNRVQWTGSGGFAAFGGGLTVTLNGNAPLTWAAASFVPNGSALVFGDATATDSVTFTNAIDLNGGNRTINVHANTANSDAAILTGSLSDGALTVNGDAGTGHLVLTAVNSYAGTTTIGGGTLALSGTGSIANSASMIDNGIFDISATKAGASIVSLSGTGTVVLGAQTLVFTAAAGTFSGAIGGTGGLSVTGGTQGLSGTNTYTGATGIGAGATLTLSGTGAIAASSSVQDNGTFDISATSAGASITTLSGNGGGIVTLGAQTLSLTAANDQFSGTISGTGGLAVTGGVEALSGTNGYTGATTIATGANLSLIGTGSIATSSAVADNGTFDISATNAGASIVTLSGTGAVALGAKTLTLTNASTTFAGSIGGTGGLTLTGGTETLTGVNGFTGATTIGTGTNLKLSGGGSIAASSGVADTGTFDISATTAGASITTLSGTGSVALGSQTLTLTKAATSFAGTIGGTGGITLTGGTETLTGANGYAGATTIATGAILKLVSGGAIATSSGVSDSGTFDVSGKIGTAFVTTLSGAGSVVLGAAHLTLSNAGDTFSGVISGTAGTFEIGGGKETLSGTNTYTGLTIVDPGANLSLTGGGAVATSQRLADNGTFDISGTTSGASVITMSGGGIVALGAKTLTLTNASSTFLGVIGGTGGLTVAAGTEVLTGTNTYTGATAINTGASLALQSGGSIATSSGVADNGTFLISLNGSNSSITTLSGNGTVVLGPRTLILTNAGDTFAGVIGGAGGLTVAAGTETLTGTNTYSGATTINAAATLALSGTGSVATSSGVIDNGTFDISATTAGAAITSLSGTGTVALGAQTLSLTNASGQFQGIIGGTGGVTMTGGSESLTGTNTYTGATIINALTTLSLSGTGSIATSSGVADNGTFSIAATTAGASIATLSGTGIVTLGSQTLSLTAAQDQFSGTIGGIGGVTVTGGTETLTGVNSFTGATIINPAATLELSGTGAIATSSGVADNGTFDISATTSGASIVTLSGSGVTTLGNQTLTLSGAHDLFTGMIGGTGGVTVAGGTQTLSGVNGYTGATTINLAATLALTGVGGIAASSGIADNGTFDISGTSQGAAITTLSGTGIVALGTQSLSLTAASTSFGGAIGGSGAVLVTGGTQTLSGTNTYTGATLIGPSGTIAMSGTGSIATSRGVNDGGTFDISATTAGASIVRLAGAGIVTLGAQTLTLTGAADFFTGAIGGTGGLSVTGGGEVLSGTNTYTGATGISGGALLALTGTGGIAASSGVADSGTFDISTTTAGASIVGLTGNGAVSLGGQTLTLTAAGGTFAGAITGGGGIAVTGGAQTLSGVNLFTGTASIGSGATLALAGGGSIATAAGVTDNGKFDISATTAGASIATLSGNGTVLLGARTLSLTNAQGSFSGSVGGSGGLTVSGGTETLTGTSTYTGGTLINNAIVAVTSDAALGAANGGLTLSNGTLRTLTSMNSSRPVTLTGSGRIDTASNAVGLSGVLSGGGGLVADGGGVLTLTGTNTYAGGTLVINKTTLAIGSDAALGAASGALVIASGELLALQSFNSGRAIIVMTGGAIDSNGFSLNLTGPIMLQQPAGTMTALFTGTATVVGPVMYGDGGLIVPTLATLSGVGTISMTTTIFGTASPGNSPGTETFTAPVTMEPGSVLSLNIDGTGTGTGAGNYSRVLVTGAGNTFTADGGTLRPILRGITGSATNTYTPPVGQSFTVVQATGGVVGSFASLAEPATGLLPGSRFDALYTPNAITLYVTPSTYTNLASLGVGLTPNQAAVGRGVDALRPLPGVRTDPATTAVLAPLFLQPVAALPSVLNTLGGSVYGDALLSAVASERMFGGAISKQLNARRGGAASITGNVVSDETYSQWADGFGGNLSVGSSGGATGYNATTGGFATGTDMRVTPNLLAGFAVGNSGGGTNSSATGGTATNGVTTVSLYGSWTAGQYFVDAQAGFAHYGVTTRRTIGAVGLASHGDGDGLGVNGGIDAGIRYTFGAWQVQPDMGLRIDQLGRGALTETDASVLSLMMHGDTVTSAQALAGVQVQTTVPLGGVYSLTPAASLHVAHEFGDVTTQTTGAFIGAGGVPMTVQSTKTGRDGVIVDMGAAMSLPYGLTAYVTYTADARSNAFAQAVTGGLRWTW
jgi:fibronectin-binding autotransporter adhesin